jgi:WD40 repeat protein
MKVTNPACSFPTVDFHMNTQRLAVGTSEGAIIMFDLKTATRLYVLEGHKQRLAACSFSPDGRRLITVSLDENVVLVWKVGSSFSSFFNPGAPPRQGHGDGEPFKTWEFNVGDAGEELSGLCTNPFADDCDPTAKLTPAETLVELKTEWVGERSVKLMVRDVTMTFST